MRILFAILAFLPIGLLGQNDIRATHEFSDGSLIDVWFAWQPNAGVANWGTNFVRTNSRQQYRIIYYRLGESGTVNGQLTVDSGPGWYGDIGQSTSGSFDGQFVLPLGSEYYFDIEVSRLSDFSTGVVESHVFNYGPYYETYSIDEPDPTVPLLNSFQTNLQHNGFADWDLYLNGNLHSSGSVATGVPGSEPITASSTTQGPWDLNVYLRDSSGNVVNNYTITNNNTSTNNSSYGVVLPDPINTNVVGWSAGTPDFIIDLTGQLAAQAASELAAIENGVDVIDASVQTAAASVVTAINTVSANEVASIGELESTVQGVVEGLQTLDSTVEDASSSNDGLLSQIRDLISSFFDLPLWDGLQDILDSALNWQMPDISWPNLEMPWLTTFTIIPDLGILGANPSFPVITFYGYSFDLNGFVSQAAPSAFFVRGIITWLIVALFLRYAIERVRNTVASINASTSIQPIIGPESIMPGIGQAKAAGKSALLLSGIVAFMTAYGTFVSSVCGINLYWADPVTGAPNSVATAIQLFGMVLPLDVMLCHAGAGVALEASCALAVMVWGTGQKLINV